MRVLLVEDEVRLSQIVARVLRQEGFDVETADAGVSGLEMALTGSFDAIILDRMLPGLDGLEVVRRLRAEGIETPVLMLTARGELPERVAGLDAGADDYLGKPFAFAELLARLRALLRRGERPLVPDLLSVGLVTIDFTRRTVVRGGRDIALTPREFALLEVLARNRGQILSRDQLLARVWGYEAEPQGNVVDLYVHYLRRKLGDLDGMPLIRTVRGAGYIFRAE